MISSWTTTQMLSSFSAPFLRWPVEFYVHIQKFCLRSVSHCVYPKCGVHFSPHKSIFFIFSINALFTFMFTLAVFFFLGFVGGVSMCITRHRIIPNSKSIQSSLCCYFPARRLRSHQFDLRPQRSTRCSQSLSHFLQSSKGPAHTASNTLGSSVEHLTSRGDVWKQT